MVTPPYSSLSRPSFSSPFYPIVAWYVLSCVLGVETLWVQAGVLIASRPSVGSNYVLAQRYAADPEHISAAIVLSTVISTVTVPFVVQLILR